MLAGHGRVWAAVLLAPAAWTLYALLAWAAVPLACREGVMPALHVAALALLAVAAGGLALARSERRNAEADDEAAFLRAIALPLAALFTLGLLLFAAANVAIDPCR